MKMTSLTIAGSLLIALSTMQFAAASEHHGKVHHRATAEYRNSNAFAAPAVQPEWSYYSGGYSAPAGR